MDDQTLAKFNALLANSELIVVQDENGWHEESSLDYFDNPIDAVIYALEYMLALA